MLLLGHLCKRHSIAKRYATFICDFSCNRINNQRNIFHKISSILPYQIISFQLFLVLHLACVIEKRLKYFKKFGYGQNGNGFWMNISRNYSQSSPILRAIISILEACWDNIYLILLSVFCLRFMYELYCFYSIFALLICPFKTWMYVFALYLHFKCSSLTQSDIERYIEQRYFKKPHSSNYELIPQSEYSPTKD